MTAGAGRREQRWQRAVREHRAALASFLEFARAVPDERWHRPAREGKWSPGEVTEHLALAYQALLRELSSGEAMAPRVRPGRQRLLRWFLLPHMLFHRSMPRARAPRETRPEQVPPIRQEGMARLQELAERAERECRSRPEARLTHPYFGSLDRGQAFRLAALHLEHHQRVASAATSAAG